MNNDISDRLENVFKSVLGIDSVPADISQKTCAEWDSVNHLNLVLALEAEFGITFEPEEIAAMTTLARTRALLASK